MSDQLLVVLRVCLLVLVYLVFLRVLRAVWVELRAEAPRSVAEPQRVPVGAAAGAARGPVAAPAPANRLQIVAPASLAGTSFALDGETTIGRAPGCGIAIDDSRISKLHARVFPANGRWYIEDLGSTNGTRVGGSVIVAAAPVSRGDRIQIGEIVLEYV